MSTSQTGRCCLLYYLRGRRKLWRQPSQSDCSCPTNEKSPYFGLLASSSELFHDYTASQTPSFPCKNKLLFLVLWICLWPAIICTSPIVLLWLFPNKLALADKITGSPVTKVDRNLMLLLSSYCCGSEESAVLPRVMDRFLIMCSLTYTPDQERRKDLLMRQTQSLGRCQPANFGFSDVGLRGWSSFRSVINGQWDNQMS